MCWKERILVKISFDFFFIAIFELFHEFAIFLVAPIFFGSKHKLRYLSRKNNEIHRKMLFFIYYLSRTSVNIEHSSSRSKRLNCFILCCQAKSPAWLSFPWGIFFNELCDIPMTSKSDYFLSSDVMGSVHLIEFGAISVHHKDILNDIRPIKWEKWYLFNAANSWWMRTFIESRKRKYYTRFSAHK